MDEPAQQTAVVPVPTAVQVLVRTLPAAVTMIIGLPLVVRALLDPSGQMRTAAGVEACDRIEVAASAAGSVSAFFILMLMRDERLWTSLTVVFAFFAVIHIVRARRGWACLRVLHAAERTG
jgi:hypothetical protein